MNMANVFHVVLTLLCLGAAVALVVRIMVRVPSKSAYGDEF
jgi:hypothetical protein